MVLRMLSCVVVGLLAMIGCRDDPTYVPPVPADAPVSPRPDSAPDSGPPPAAQIKLQAIKAQRQQRVGLAKPANDNVFVAVQLSMSNTGEARPLPVDASTFSLATEQHILYHQSAQSAAIAMACPVNAAVANGGTLVCQAAFEVPRMFKPNGVEYADDTERRATAPIATVEPAQVLCASWSTSAPDCASCLSSFVPRACVLEGQSVGAACVVPCVLTGGCPRLPPDPSDCVASEACLAAVDVYQGCVWDACRSVCS